MQQYFIAGTDTDVGKTYVTQKLLLAANAVGLSTLGYKPIAAGCEKQGGQWVNDDAIKLQTASSIKVPLQEINPIAFPPPVAPHIAAAEQNIVISAEAVAVGLQQLQTYRPDVLLMEGAGGWRLPINRSEFLSDVVKKLELPVIVVVGMRLGCINHALLTIEAIKRDKLPIKGWIANRIDHEMLRYQENLTTLKQRISEPLLAEVPFSQAIDLVTLGQIFR